MKFASQLLKAELKGRRKRFFADVVLPNGTSAIAHCPNPGSMLGNANPGFTAYLTDLGADYLNQGRKLRYRWSLVDNGNHLVCIDTMLSNKIFYEALQEKRLPEFSVYGEIIPEFSVGTSRLDFLLKQKPLPDCFVEIKSVSLIQDQVAYFPDSVTKRGQKHLAELIALKKRGHKCVLAFIIQAQGIKTFRPADFIDKEYGRLLRLAVAAGVEVLVYDVKLSAAKITLGRRRRLDLRE